MFQQVETDKITGVKKVWALMKLKYDANSEFCAARNVLLALERKIDQLIDGFLSMGNPNSVEAGNIET